MTAPDRRARARPHEEPGGLDRCWRSPCAASLAHKRRLVSTVIAILLGVAFMAGSLVFTDTMRASLSGVFQDAERSTDALVRGPATIDERRTAPSTSRCRAAWPTELAAVDGVGRGRAAASRASPRSLGTRRQAGRRHQHGRRAGRRGVDRRRAAQPVRAGRPAAAPRADDEVVVDRSTRRRGRPRARATARRCSPAPRPQDDDRRRHRHASAGQDNRAGNRTVLFTLDTADRLLGAGRPGRQHRGAGRRRGRARPSWRGGSRPCCPAADSRPSPARRWTRRTATAATRTSTSSRSS